MLRGQPGCGHSLTHLGGHLKSQHSDGATEFASRVEAALIKSSFSLPKHLFLQNS